MRGAEIFSISKLNSVGSKRIRIGENWLRAIFSGNCSSVMTRCGSASTLGMNQYLSKRIHIFILLNKPRNALLYEMHAFLLVWFDYCKQKKKNCHFSLWILQILLKSSIYTLKWRINLFATWINHSVLNVTVWFCMFFPLHVPYLNVYFLFIYLLHIQFLSSWTRNFKMLKIKNSKYLLGFGFQNIEIDLLIVFLPKIICF